MSCKWLHVEINEKVQRSLWYFTLLGESKKREGQTTKYETQLHFLKMVGSLLWISRRFLNLCSFRRPGRCLVRGRLVLCFQFLFFLLPINPCSIKPSATQGWLLRSPWEPGPLPCIETIPGKQGRVLHIHSRLSWNGHIIKESRYVPLQQGWAVLWHKWILRVLFPNCKLYLYFQVTIQFINHICTSVSKCIRECLLLPPSWNTRHIYFLPSQA